VGTGVKAPPKCTPVVIVFYVHLYFSIIMTVYEDEREGITTATYLLTSLVFVLVLVNRFYGVGQKYLTKLCVEYRDLRFGQPARKTVFCAFQFLQTAYRYRSSVNFGRGRHFCLKICV